jgi:hypothetical protein
MASRLNSALSGCRLFVVLLILLALGSGRASSQQTCTGISRRPQNAVVYILGAVKHPCIYVLEKRETFTLYQALALAGGLSETAEAGGAKVIRRHNDGSAVAEVPDLRKILRAGAQDIELGAGDILFIPDSRPPRPPQPRLPPGDPILHNYQLSGGALCPVGANS